MSRDNRETRTPRARFDQPESIMCYADTDTHADGTATAFCYCGWCSESATPADAEHAATAHERRQDIGDD